MFRFSYSIRALMLLVSLIAFGCWYLFTPTETERVYGWLVKQDEETLGSIWSVEPAFTSKLVLADVRRFEELLAMKQIDLEGHAFYHLAHDGAAGVFLLWARATNPDPPSVIYITSDGGYGVVSKSFLDFPHILAHGVHISPYSDPPSVKHSNVHLRKKEVLEQFKEKVVEQYGPLQPLEELTSGRNEINTEFRDWVSRYQTPPRPVKRREPQPD